jgi:receptor protein-tyrosine kinase
LASAGHRVAVIEADLRRPKVTEYLGMVGSVGLTNVLAGSAGLQEVLQPNARTGFTVLAAGPLPPNPGELLASAHMANLLAEIRTKNDYVLVDAPPLLPVADGTGLATLADGVLVSVRHGRTTYDQLKQAIDLVERVGARPLGLVLNIVPPGAMTSRYDYAYVPSQTIPPPGDTDTAALASRHSDARL